MDSQDRQDGDDFENCVRGRRSPDPVALSFYSGLKIFCHIQNWIAVLHVLANDSSLGRARSSVG
jgi:hypothetical protein